MNRMPSNEEVVAFEVMPFTYLRDNDSSAAFSEYVLYTEMPDYADADQVYDAVLEGLSIFLSDDGTHPAQLYWFLIGLDKYREFVPWGPWLDETIIKRIFDTGMEARRKLDSAPTHQFVDKELSKYATQ